MNRKQKRAEKKKEIKAISRLRLTTTIIKQLEFIFKPEYRKDNPRKTKEPEDFRELFEHLTNDCCCDDGCINEDAVYRKNKETLLEIYKKTSKCCAHIVDYYELKAEVYNSVTGKTYVK